VQNLIEDLLQSRDGLCAACFDERKLERATARCRDCRRSLCDECSAGHGAETKHHGVESLVERNCDDHRQKLELHCFQCCANICVACFSQGHQGHRCDSIRTLADELTAKLTHDVERLSACRSRLEEVLGVLQTQKEQYESYLSRDTEERTEAEIRGQRYRASLESLKLDKRRRIVEDFVRTKAKAVDAAIQRGVGGRQARRLLRDVGVILHVIVVDLASHAAILSRYVRAMETLTTKAGDMLASCSSIYDAAEKSTSAMPFHGRVGELLEHVSTNEDPHRVSIGKRKLSIL